MDSNERIIELITSISALDEKVSSLNTTIERDLYEIRTLAGQVDTLVGRVGEIEAKLARTRGMRDGVLFIISIASAGMGIIGTLIAMK